MNRLKFTLLALTACLSLSAFGASIDHIQNYSAEYGGNPAQQGAINVGSTVYFNPAGLMRLENGTYFVGGLQYAFGDQNMESNGKDYSTDLSSPIPNMALYKKTNDGAYFWTVGAIGGGASLEYKNSIPLPEIIPGKDTNDLLKNTNIKGSNQYVQTTIGKAYNLTNKWSASVALRGVYGKRTLKASTNFMKNNIKIDSERTAFGIGGQFGLNYVPNNKLNIGFRYDTPIKLDFKTKATYPKNFISNALLDTYPVYRDGLKTRRDLPGLMALGASYKVTDKWTTFVGGNYYFNEAATMDRVEKMNVDYHNGWEVSVGSEYWLNNKYAWLVGMNYADTG
uniref:OmpP1/FadL family transporter n=1 Tax=uncultured Cetobacterium sp. TaxID=527638 RepID=UPI00263A157F